MANVKISQLPSWTGSQTDLRWFVMNNSGETETFKFSGYTSPYKSISGTARLAPVDGSNNIVSGNYSAILFGESNDLSSSGTHNTLGGYNHTFSLGSYSAILAGYEHTTPYNFNYSFAGGGYQHQLGGVANGFIGGTGNFALNDYVNKTFFGAGQGNSAEGGDRNGFVGGFSNFIYGSEDSTMIGGNDNFMLYSNNSSILGGNNNTLRVDFSVKGNGILFGQYNEIKGQAEADSARDFNTIINGGYNIISGASSYYNTIMGGFNNGIDDGYNSHIIGSTGSTISGKTNAVMVGTTNRTADKDNTTYVENLRIYRQSISGNYNNGSQSTGYNIDWDNGNMQKITLTGNLVFSATNISDGATYILKLVQDGSGNRTATWTSSQFKWPNGTAPTLSTGANAVDIITFAAMDGVLYGVAQKNFS